jgi:protein tyrosine phosphatase (PTP) superfamily phosphohydrolase (DUF442 family)
MKRARWRTWSIRVALAGAILAGSAVGWVYLTGNFAEVVGGQVYRSAQVDAPELARAVRDHHVRTVLNLRGHHPESAWYRAERQTTLGWGATQVDIPLSSCEWMSKAQLRTLVGVLESCEKPVLIHCHHGSERTGLASALAILLREGSTLDGARAQFSARYLFVPWGDGVVTLRHLDQYEGWLGRNGLAHSPARLRRWVAEGYVPGSPSRESWPYDPYPLVVTTTPAAGGPVERKVWDDRGRATAGKPVGDLIR